MPQPNSINYITIGRFGRTYGVQGWIKVIAFTEPNSNILNYSHWYAQQGQQWTALDIAAKQLHGQVIIAKLHDIDTPESAKPYTGLEIAILREQLPQLKDNEIYLCDLPGFQVINQQGEHLGEITHLFNSGAHEILCVKGAQSYLIPFVREQFVLQIDQQQRTISVAWQLEDTA